MAAAATGAIVIAAAGVAVGATGASGTPGQSQSASGGERPSVTQNPGRGNGGNRPGNGGGGGNGGNGSTGGGNGGNGSTGGGRPGGNPITTPPSAPATPVAPLPRPPVVTPPGGSGGNGGNGASGGGSSGPAGPSGGSPATRPATPAAGGGTGAGSGGGSVSPSGGAGNGGTGSQGSGGQASGGGTIMAPPVPKGLATQGLRAGSGPVDVTVYMDLSDSADASTYLSVTTRLLARVANERSATITFSPLIMGSDSNSMEAALAVLAGANQNRTWCVTGQVAATRSMRGGDWINRTVLRSIARACGLSSRRFVRDATGNRLYPRLNDIREQAQADGVGATPSYVVKGDGGAQVVVNPGSADAVASAISGVG